MRNPDTTKELAIMEQWVAARTHAAMVESIAYAEACGRAFGVTMPNRWLHALTLQRKAAEKMVEYRDMVRTLEPEVQKFTQINASEMARLWARK